MIAIIDANVTISNHFFGRLTDNNGYQNHSSYHRMHSTKALFLLCQRFYKMLTNIYYIHDYDREMPNSNSKFSERPFVYTARKSATAGIARQITLLCCLLESAICTLPATLVFINCHTIFQKIEKQKEKVEKKNAVKSY